MIFQIKDVTLHSDRAVGILSTQRHLSLLCSAQQIDFNCFQEKNNA